MTVGTQKFSFDRLFRKMDELVSNGSIIDKVIGQKGVTHFVPSSFETFNYIDAQTMENYIKRCEILITHGGTASIIQGLKFEKKIIVVPRIKKFKEHVDNHQIEIARFFESKNYVETVYDISELKEKILLVRRRHYDKFTNDNTSLLNSIDSFIKKTFGK
ncbi:glycosyltransferase family 28 [Sporolactobacillus sp. CPB3-1]|uniref:Glycosyltransferase family 28 n=1 Tax=Sporolactobacillus mangiferae TaxID=2940498 RepID=A0ABT0M8H1_9BACL|nr:PssE/Cps14G family polysaccharide biosynthesis glycosyltransferase [Sporolactobacillus mangiferae]MCL1631170.1 glycosyltransferase family 28 [Sporolactobacillus mangiferae]